MSLPWRKDPFLVKLREQLGKEPDFAGNLPAHLRLDWDPYFIQIAFAVAERGDCTRMKVGAVITDKDHRIMATGYNGAPAGFPGCLEGACPRGKHYLSDKHGDFITQVCACGNRWPCSKSAKPGEGSYDDCISCHAEANAIVYAGRDRCIGSTLYCTYAPCHGCLKLIKAAAISRVVIP
jgi:dCMP deaminase